MSYLLKVFYSMLYIEEIVKYITSKSNCSKWRKLRCLIREKKRFLFNFFPHLHDWDLVLRVPLWCSCISTYFCIQLLNLYCFFCMAVTAVLVFMVSRRHF